MIHVLKVTANALEADGVRHLERHPGGEQALLGVGPAPTARGADPIADGQPVDPVTDGGDLPCPLHTEDHRQLARVGPAPEVGVDEVEPCRLDLHPDLARPRLGNGHIDTRLE